MKRLFLSIVCLALAGATFSCVHRGADQSAPAPSTAAQPAVAAAEDVETAFPILGWGWLGTANHLGLDTNPDFYREMADCGFTIAGFASSPAQVAAAKEGGIQVFYMDGRISNKDWATLDIEQFRKDLTEINEQWKDEPTVRGYYLQDEPRAAALDGLAAACQIVREVAPDKDPYVNLFSNSTQLYNYAPLSYEEYVEKVMASNPAPNTGYDQYVFYENNHVRETLFSCCEVFRRLSLKHHKAWWYCGLSIAHRNYAVPTYAQLSLAAWSAIAYGAKGLAWFTYLDGNRTGWHSAPLNAYGDRTPTWYRLKQVNRAVQSQAEVLLRLRNDRTYHFGSTVPESNERLNGPDAGSLIVGALNGNHWLVGEFTHEQTGDRYLVVVNTDMTHSNEFTPVWREGKAPSQVRVRLMQLNPAEIPFNRTPNDTNIFEPGGAAVLHLIYDQK